MKKYVLSLVALALLVTACKKGDPIDHSHFSNEDAATFSEIGSIKVGELGAAEITAFDPETNRLFVVTNSGSSRIDILDLSNPALPVLIGNISITPYGGGVNSVSVSDGKLAAAVEGFVKTDPGKVVVFRTKDYKLVKEIPVGALPDMVTYSPDGEFILTANEGEPNDSYTIDPVGSVSIIEVKRNYAVQTIGFEAFSGKKDELLAKGLRIYGPNASFMQDIEPEYVAISQDSRTAWVTLQENNGIAKIDIKSRKVTNIFPLGFKSFNLAENAIDPSDRDGGINFNAWPVKASYLPDGIGVFELWGKPYVFTANEGDAREYAGFVENKRVKDIVLNPAVFTDATLRTDAKLGRLNITTTLGNTDGDAKNFEELYTGGARSFSVWNGNTGALLFDSKNELDKSCAALGYYDDARSDDKGVEPEGMTLGWVGKRPIAFVGMERADAVAIYDISQPTSPVLIKILKTGDAPEGVTFVPACDSPTKKSLLIVSSENDGVVKVYSVE